MHIVIIEMVLSSNGNNALHVFSPKTIFDIRVNKLMVNL